MLLRCAERHRGAGRSRPACAADAMYIRFRFRGKVIVDDVGDVFDMQATSRDVGRDKHGRLRRPKLTQCTGTCALALVAVQRRGGHAGLNELPNHLVRSVLGAREHQRPCVRRLGQQAHQQRRLLWFFYVMDPVSH